MTESTYQPAAYTPPTLRIAATYAVPQVGEATEPVAGHPDNVEIEINLSEGDGGVSAEFVTEVVSSLFRFAPAGTTPAVTVDQGSAALPYAPTPGGVLSYPPGVRSAGVQPWSAATETTTNAASGTEAA